MDQLITSKKTAVLQ